MIFVSCCNKDGGIFAIEEDTLSLVKVIDEEARGICHDGRVLFVCTDRGLRGYDFDMNIVARRDKDRNWHGIRCQDGILFIIFAAKDAIMMFTKDLNPFLVPSIDLETPMGPNRVNDLFLYGGSIYYSAFYVTAPQGKAESPGAVCKWPGNEIVIDGLEQPHTPFVHHDNVFVCNSAKRTVQQGHNVICETDSYTRGLYIDDNFIWIGLSKFRRGKNPDARCGVIRKTRKTGKEVFIQIPATEVYGIEKGA